MPSTKEFDAVVQLPGDERYRYFLKRVADDEIIWGLWREGWAMLGDPVGERLLAVWPHSLYAQACAKQEWEGYEPRAITMEVWLSKWIPGLRADGTMLAIFPTPSGNTVLVDPEKCEIDLREALSAYG